MNATMTPLSEDQVQEIADEVKAVSSRADKSATEYVRRVVDTSRAEVALRVTRQRKRSSFLSYFFGGRESD